MPIPRSTGRRSAPAMSSSGSLGKSSAARIKWRRLFAQRGVVYYCFMRSSAVYTSTNSRCPLHHSSNQTPRFYTPLDKLPHMSINDVLESVKAILQIHDDFHPMIYAIGTKDNTAI